MAISLKALITTILVVMSTIILSGCGFALRGTHNTALAIAKHQAQVAITLEDTPTAFALYQPLKTQLNILGISTDAHATSTLTVKNVRFRRYELIGTLTEVRLVLMADVSYTFIKEGRPQTQTHTLQVERSYQHNEASVATLDQQGGQVSAWLYAHLSERIAEQYRANALD